MFIIDAPSMLIGALFFSGFWPLFLTIVFIIVAILSSTSEAFTVSYIATVIFAILLAIFTTVNPFVAIWNHPAMAFGLLIAYIGVGSLYSVYKYSVTFRKIVASVSKAKAEYINLNNLNIAVTDPIPELYMLNWKSFRYNNSYYTNGYDHSYYTKERRIDKTRIMNWIVFWPFSAVGVFVADPLHALVTHAYNMMVSTYKLIRTNIIKGYLNESDLD